MDKKIRILHVEDLQSDAELICMVLKRAGFNFEILVVETGNKFIAALKDFAPDIILADHSLPSFSSDEALDILKAQEVDIPFILLTASMSDELAVEMIKKGADDYLLKDRPQRLPVAIDAALEKFRLRKERRLYLEELARNEKKYRTLVENNADAIAILTAEGQVVYASPAVTAILGYTEEEMLQQDAISLSHPDDIPELIKSMIYVMERPGIPVKANCGRMRHKNGSWRWMESTVTNMLHDLGINGVVDNFRDVTERKLAEEKIRSANRMLAFLSQINQAIVHIDNAPALFREACRIAIEFGKFKAAWVGRIDAAHQRLTLVEGYGIHEEDLHRFKDVPYDVGGPQSFVVTTGQNYVCNDIACMLGLEAWKLFAAGRGINSFLVLPIWQAGHIVATFNLYAPEINFFQPEEIKLLGEATKDISFALDIFDREKQRVAAEASLRENELQLKQAQTKLISANRLYAFISGINQTIVHINNKQQLFEQACRIAVQIGMFEVAWIGEIDTENKKISLVAQNNGTPSDIEFLTRRNYRDILLTENVLNKNGLHIINDFLKEEQGNESVRYALARGFRSAIAIPIRKAGKIEFTFNLLSSKPDFFNLEEIGLLEEAAGDISFALAVFEKERNKQVAETRLKHNELRLKQAQEIAHFGSWEIDFTTGISMWSDEFLRIYGIAQGSNKQGYDVWLAFIHPDDLEATLASIKESQAASGTTNVFFRIIRQDGSVRHIQSQSQFEYDALGQVSGLYGVDHDTTEIKGAEEAVKLSEANLRLIVDQIPHAIFIKNASGEFIFANKNFGDIYGLEPEDIVRRDFAQMVPEHNVANHFLAEDLEVINTGISKVMQEAKFIDYKGIERIFYTTKMPYTVVGTNEKAVLGISLDITGEKQAEAERTKIISDILQRNNDLEQFSYIVSHNLRGPVTNIIGLTNVLGTIENTEEEKQFIIEGIVASVKRLDNVVMDLNKVLQVKHQVNESREWVQCSKMIADIKLSMISLFNTEHVAITTHFPGGDELLTVKSYLYSIFFNLISNSIKYRRSDKHTIIEIKGQKQGNKMELTIKDNGLGIDLTQNGAHLFGLYKRFHHHIEGKGMGLYMVKTQVEILGGKINVESEVNKGTTFKIVFDNN